MTPEEIESELIEMEYQKLRETYLAVSGKYPTGSEVDRLRAIATAWVERN